MQRKDLTLILGITAVVIVITAAGVGVIIWQQVREGGLTGRPSDAPIYVRQGYDMLASGDPAAAVDCFDRALVCDPGHIEAMLARGEAFEYAGDWRSMHQAYSKALEHEPQNVEALFGRARAVYTVGGLEEALADLDRAIEASSTTPGPILELRANVYEALGDAEAATADWSALTKLAPATYLPKRAMQLYDLRRFEEAEKHLTAYLEAASQRNIEWALEMRGRARIASGDFQGALADLDSVLSRQPTSTVYADAGWAHWGLGQYERALEMFEQAVRHDPSHEHARFARGAALMHLGRHDEATMALREAIDMSWQPSPYPAFFLWVALARQGERQQADATLRSRGFSGSPWSGRITFFLLGDVTEAELLKSAQSRMADISVDEQRCEALYYAGAKRLIEGDAEGAAELFRNCVDLGIYNYYEHHAARAELRRMEE